MPKVKSGWLLPTDEVIYLENFSHSEVAIKFLSGLMHYDSILGDCCLKDFKHFLSRPEYEHLDLSDVIEDYAVLCLRWIKLGNAFNYYDNKTTTIANYDTSLDKIWHYKNIGYKVNVIPIEIHCYATIDEKEYENMNVNEIINMGNENYDEYLSKSGF